MPHNPFAEALAQMREFFLRSTACLAEEDSAFAPRDGMLTVAQQVAHVAQTIDWFVEGAFRPEGFSVDFGAMDGVVRRVKSLAEARRWLERSFRAAIDTLEGKGVAEMQQAIAPGPILGGAPRTAILAGLGDHTAHHRGALTVYARLLGKVPAMPYGA